MVLQQCSEGVLALLLHTFLLLVQQWPDSKTLWFSDRAITMVFVSRMPQQVYASLGPPLWTLIRWITKVKKKRKSIVKNINKNWARPSKCSEVLIHVLSFWVEDVEVPQTSEGKHLQCDVFSAILISIFQTLVSTPGGSRDSSQNRASQQEMSCNRVLKSINKKDLYNVY